MGRPAKFSADQILDAALELLVEHGPAGPTTVALGERLGAPTGSLYHRFRSRDLLLATLWVRTVERFQQGFVAALDADDVEAAALHTPRWCRLHPDEAGLLLLHRRTDLVAAWPAELGEELRRIERVPAAALEGYLARHPGLDATTLAFAVVDVPYGAVRRHLGSGHPPPPQIDDLIVTTCRALLQHRSVP